MTYSREDKYEGRHPLKKGTSQYKRGQQGCTIAKGWDMDKKDHSQDYDVGKKSDDRRKQHSQENLEEQYKREGDCSSIGKKKMD